MEGNQEEVADVSVTPENKGVEETHQEETQEQRQGNKPDGWEVVDLPEPVQKRFNKIYGQMKYQERSLKESEAVLKAQADVIEELRKSQHQVVGFLHEKDYQDAEKSLMAQKRQARDAGNWDAVDDIDSQLLDIKAKKINAQSQPKTQQPQVTRQPQSEAFQIEQAVQKGAISNDEAQTYTAWTNETDEYGEQRRAWASPSHPQYRAAIIEGKAVFTNPAYQNKSFQEKLAEIDRRMNVPKRQTPQQVLGSNLTRGSGNGKMSVKLNSTQQKIAVGTRAAGPGKSNDEHIAAYAKMISSTGGRK